MGHRTLDGEGGAAPSQRSRSGVGNNSHVHADFNQVLLRMHPQNVMGRALRHFILKIKIEHLLIWIGFNNNMGWNEWVGYRRDKIGHELRTVQATQ